jgi:hypothetical protein
VVNKHRQQQRVAEKERDLAEAPSSEMSRALSTLSAGQARCLSTLVGTAAMALASKASFPAFALRQACVATFEAVLTEFARASHASKMKGDEALADPRAFFRHGEISRRFRNFARAAVTERANAELSKQRKAPKDSEPLGWPKKRQKIDEQSLAD